MFVPRRVADRRIRRRGGALELVALQEHGLVLLLLRVRDIWRQTRLLDDDRSNRPSIDCFRFPYLCSKPQKLCLGNHPPRNHSLNRRDILRRSSARTHCIGCPHSPVLHLQSYRLKSCSHARTLLVAVGLTPAQGRDTPAAAVANGSLAARMESKVMAAHILVAGDNVAVDMVAVEALAHKRCGAARKHLKLCQ